MFCSTKPAFVGVRFAVDKCYLKNSSVLELFCKTLDSVNAENDTFLYSLEDCAPALPT